MGNLDDDDYDRLLAIQTDIDSDGFPVNYIDWKRYGEDDDGNEYPHWQFEIDGEFWFDKYDRSNTEESISIRRSGEQSINILGTMGLVNSVFSIWVWFTFLTDYLNNTDFWFSWFGPCVVNGALWIPLTLTWPAAQWGGLTMIFIIKIMAQLTLIGPFIAYWANAGAMYYTFYMEPEASESTFATTSDANPYFGGYIVLSLINSVVSLLTVRDVVAYYNDRVE